MRRRTGGCRGWCWCPGRPGWASRGWAGSSRSTPMAWRRTCGGTGAGACPTGRGWRSGRWPRSSGSGWASPRKTRRGRRGQAGGGWTGSSPIRPSGRMSGVRLGRLLGVAFAGRRRGPLTREELFAGWRLFFERLAGGAAGGAGGRGRPVRRCGAAGLPGPSGRLGSGPAGLRAGVRPARAGPGPARVRRRPEPEHADAGPAGSGVDGPAGGRAGARDAGRRRGRRSPVRPRVFRCSRWRRCGR